jgi:hypothetical protein
MKPTRRGFLGLVGGAVGAAIAGVKWLPAQEAEEIHEVIPTYPRSVVPTFKIQRNQGPPWVAGDVLLKKKTREMYLVKVVTGPLNPSPLLGMTGTGNWESELMLVPIDGPDSPIGIPVKLASGSLFTRVGKSYNEGKDFPR